MQAADRLEELFTDDFEFAGENPIRAARELRNLGGDVAVKAAQKFIAEHINCDRHTDQDHDHSRTHADAEAGDPVEPAAEPHPFDSLCERSLPGGQHSRPPGNQVSGKVAEAGGPDEAAFDHPALEQQNGSLHAGFGHLLPGIASAEGR